MNSREVALHLLQQWANSRRLAEELLDATLAGSTLSLADRGFATELFYGCLRQQLALDFITVQLVTKPPRVIVRDILHLGLYQIHFLRTPPHAAVHETVELPDTAISVLHKETRHLFTNVFEVVAHGLNLHRTDILSNRGLKEIVASSAQVMDIDVTERYYGGVKTLYSAIIDFATRDPAVANMNAEQIARVHGIRLACRDAAEIIKLLSQTRPNINRYMTSDNDAMREQYNLMRLNLAKCLRALFSIRDEDDPSAVQSALQALRDDVAKRDALADGTVDRLVRDRTITPSMATSLMNDSATTTAIGNALVDIDLHLAESRPRK